MKTENMIIYNGREAWNLLKNPGNGLFNRFSITTPALRDSPTRWRIFMKGVYYGKNNAIEGDKIDAPRVFWERQGG
jgi:hypothetical protein